jgi:RNA polymerase sigma-70 factor (ECF subfamily)
VTVDDKAWLADRFEENRLHLRSVALRMLGTASEADDAVQESWLRLSRADTGEVKNIGGWLTTVVARVCLDMLRARKSRREEPLAPHLPEPTATDSDGADPEHETLLADSVGSALLVVLDTLAPLERVAFVLHDLFGMPFEEIAPIVGRSPAATRQLASRGRRRVQGGGATASDQARRREVVDAFLAASRGGDLAALLTVLAPDVVLRADDTAVVVAAANKWGGAPDLAPEMRGAQAVADAFKGRARGAQAASIDGAPGAVWMQGGQARAVFAFTVENGKIVAIDLVMDPAHLAELTIALE